MHVYLFRLWSVNACGLLMRADDELSWAQSYLHGFVGVETCAVAHWCWL